MWLLPVTTRSHCYLPDYAWCYLWLLQVTTGSQCYLLPDYAWCYLWLLQVTTSCLDMHGVTCGYFRLPQVPIVTSSLTVHGVTLLQVTTRSQCYLLPWICTWCYLWLLQVTTLLPPARICMVLPVVTSGYYRFPLLPSAWLCMMLLVVPIGYQSYHDCILTL